MAKKKAAAKAPADDKAVAAGDVVIADEKGGSAPIAAGRKLKRGDGAWGADAPVSQYRKAAKEMRIAKRKSGVWVTGGKVPKAHRTAPPAAPSALVRDGNRWIEKPAGE